MDSLSALIGKLNEQFQQNASPAQLLETLRSIEQVLQPQTVQPLKTLGTAKVAVIMPVAPSEPPLTAPEPSGPASLQETSKPASDPVNGRLFPATEDIPTLAQQKNTKEINDTIPANPFSLNDKLKNEVVEVGHLLTETPVRDLKKAIGINDRFVFINELFRNDDSMYERSIKTINGFRILAEAEYWMERELKVKLGWNEESECVKHFYQLVRRRFTAS
jgi:hypothetical protein